MKENLLLYLLLNIGLLMLAATILTELRPLRRILKRQSRSLPNQLWLGLIFGALTVVCTYTGLEFQGAVVNTRVISAVAAGLVGGPLSGVMAGLIGGVHRYLYNPAGFTSLACGLGTFCFGLIGAACYRWFPRRKNRYLTLTGITIFAELVQCVIILAVAKPFSAAVALEKAILLPKILVNSAGLILFMELLDRLNRSLTIELVEQQSLALYIAQECLPFLREGIENRPAMQRVVDTVRKTLSEFCVALTSLDQVVASSGMEGGEAAVSDAAARAIRERRLVVVREGLGGHSGHLWDDWALLAAPLSWQDRPVGALVLAVPQGPNLVLDADVRTAEGLAQLFSTMLELGELQHQVELRQQAELRALQSQINPHFLFNALNTVSALCLTNPDRARETILVLARYFRQTLSLNEPFVTLRQELDNVDNYLFLTEARFEDAIHVTRELPDDLDALKLPPLILQPIVENAVRHGGKAVDDRRVHIRIRQDGGRAYIQVSDQGRGFPPQVLEKLQDPDDPTYTGLFNVRKRLRSVYGGQCDFSIDSTGRGSTVSFSIPLTPPA